jgi:hypothetical protein
MSATRPTSEGTAPSSVALPFCKPNNNNNNNNDNNNNDVACRRAEENGLIFQVFGGVLYFSPFFSVVTLYPTLSVPSHSLFFPLPCNTSFSLALAHCGVWHSSQRSIKR